MRVIAFCGPKGCGKDSAAQGLFKQNTPEHTYFRKTPFAEGVKNMCEDFFGWTPDQMDDMTFKETVRPYWKGGPRREPRWIMMDFANWMRDNIDPDVHTQRWERNARKNYSPSMCHVVTDLRFPDELNVLRKLDALVVYVKRPEAEAHLEALQQAGDLMALNPSEAHYTQLRIYAEEKGRVILNNRGVDILEAKAQAIISSRMGYWGNW